jgi:NADH:ubiquinone oxidoreductase subunit 4 (subunit M)
VLGSFQYSGWVAAATMLVVIISAVYMLWMFQRVFFAVPSTGCAASGRPSPHEPQRVARPRAR